MSIKDWPVSDRPIEKLLIHGAGLLTDAELIAISMKTGTRGKNALTMAKELLVEHEGLKKLLKTPKHILCKKPGLGKAKYAALMAALELGRRYLEESVSLGTVLNSSKKTYKFLQARLGDLEHEAFACLFLDNHYRLISFEILFQGTINEAVVYPREIVKRALTLNASHLLLAHNHPSGHATPSHADQETTCHIQSALKLVGIRIVDHVIVTGKEYFSFAENGLL